MRPSKLGPSSFISHVFLRNDIYYYRSNVPVDLLKYFPTTEIKQSLKTKESKIAKVLAISIEYKIQRAFAIIRTGMLSDDMIQQVVEDIVPSKRKLVAKSMLLADTIKNYVLGKQAEWTDKTKMEVQGVFKLLIDLLGNIEVTKITRPMVLELRSTLQKLPPNVYKKYPGKAIAEVLKQKDVEAMSIKSVNKHVTRLGSLLRYCVDEGYIQSNPATGLKITEKKRVDQERSTYSIDDIRQIVLNLAADENNPERYWIPLIGLYSGMRLNEICQLYVEDIIQFDNVWCFSINGEKDKSLKNAASERVLPVHPVLVQLGFIKFVDTARKVNASRLWPTLSYCKINGYTNSFGKWYQRFNREHVTDDPKKVFHSMRHTVADTLKQKGVQDVVISEILGHAHQSITTGRYGKRYQPKVLLEALLKLDYGIDVEPMKF